jgi:hypothetical protein
MCDLWRGGRSREDVSGKRHGMSKGLEWDLVAKTANVPRMVEE